MKRPLEGIRVLDCGIYHAGPGGPAILGDLGAEVIKIEEPEVGDPLRAGKRIGSIPLEIPGGKSFFNEGANRSKKGVTLNLKSEKGREILFDLARQSDVFLTSMRPEVVKRMNITYPVLRKINPRLIYASVSAFGPKGPDRNRGGFDYQGQARSGFMWSMGEEGGPPMVNQFAIIDQATAIQISHQIITALYMRERTGIGQEVHVSILGASMFLLYFNVMMAPATGYEMPRRMRTTAHPMRNYYQCKDDRWLMMTLTPTDRFWRPLCQALGHPELENDPRFDTDDKRLENAELLVAMFDDIFATRTLEEWLHIFEDYDLFVCAVNSLIDLGSDPQVIENDYLVDFDHPTLGKIKIPGYPGYFSEAQAGTTCSAPDLGQHTEEVLMDILGLSKADIKKLRDEGIV
jgi:crotonobetainyl-CoA:carnitine CoA-transferase CaiB-like acyl-CoA transferase